MAMFDEYDEGTALLNMADGYSMIPTNQYFLTSSADGTYISPDFYLRLAGKATRVIKGIDPVTTSVTIPFSVGPVYFRTSVEATIDPTPSWTSTTELKTNVTTYGSNFGNPACAVVTENPHRGSSALRVQGRDRSATTSYAYFKVFDVNIPVYANTQLSFWTNPANALGRYVSVDLIMTDGRSLRDCGAFDVNGVSMHPATGRGTVNTWTKTTSVIGTWLNGKTIDRILVAYDHRLETGDFRTYVDDISIDTGIPASLPIKLAYFTTQMSANGRSVQVNWGTLPETNSYGFWVEKSPNEQTDCVTIQGSFIPGHGATNEAQHYSYIDSTVNSGVWYYRLKQIDLDGTVHYCDGVRVNLLTDVKEKEIPTGFSLSQNYPNPFNPSTTIRYGLPHNSFVTLTVYNSLGEQVAQLVNEQQQAGNHDVTFRGDGLASGVYFYRVQAGDFVASRKLLLLK